MDESRYTYIGLQRGGGSDRREADSSQPGALQVEFLVEYAEEIWDGEIASGF